MSDDELKSRLMGPAVGMIVVGIIDLLLHLFNLLYYGMAGTAGIAIFMEQQKPESSILMAVGAFGLCLALFGILTGGFLIYAGIKTTQLKSHRVAMIGCIVLMLPMVNCCIIGLPFGVWGLMVLNDLQVREAFDRREMGW